MTGDPAIEAAAVALLRGRQDPIRYLSYEGVERIVADAALTRASELYSEEMRTIVDAVGISVGNRVGEIVGKIIASMRG